VAERYRGMDALFGALSSGKRNLVLKKPRTAEMNKELGYYESASREKGGGRERERAREEKENLEGEASIVTITYGYRADQFHLLVFSNTHLYTDTYFQIQGVDVHCFLGTWNTGCQVVDRNFHHSLYEEGTGISLSLTLEIHAHYFLQHHHAIRY
jgi:hypothetical protein